jgi:hypothetical protein
MQFASACGPFELAVTATGNGFHPNSAGTFTLTFNGTPTISFRATDANGGVIGELDFSGVGDVSASFVDAQGVHASVGPQKFDATTCPV